MSLLRIIRQQLGLSVTPANNFTLDASADNGTMKLARGNAGATTQDILTVDATGKVAFPQNAQTWQDVSATRLLNTDYLNNTGQPIKISVAYSSTAVSQAIIGYVNSSVVIRSGDSTATSLTVSVYFEVPNGATFQIQSTAPTRQFWKELR